MLELVPGDCRRPARVERPQIHRAQGERRARVALLCRLCAAGAGAADQRGDDPSADAQRRGGGGRAGCRLLRRTDAPHGSARSGDAQRTANIAAWSSEIAGEGLDAIVINASGCGTTVKDYGFMFRAEPEPWRSNAENVSALACDISEFLVRFGYAPAREQPGLTVAYHSACSLQHGQQVTTQPKALLQRAGFTVVEPAEPHICCGSAGTYNLLQPEIAGRLRERKLGNLRAIAAGPDRRRQHRLHHATRWRRNSCGAHDRTARLDGRRPATRGNRALRSRDAMFDACIHPPRCASIGHAMHPAADPAAVRDAGVRAERRRAGRGKARGDRQAAWHAEIGAQRGSCRPAGRSDPAALVECRNARGDAC